MRLLLVAPFVAPIDEARGQLGGVQVLVGDLARGLSGRGHAVTLLAPLGSRVPGVRIPSLEIDEAALRPASFAPNAVRVDDAAQVAAFAAARAWLDRHALEFDLVHAHAFDAPAFRAFRAARLPVLHTLHLPPLHADVASAVRELGRTAVLIAVSEASARSWRGAGVPVDRVVPNGIPLARIPFGATRGRYLLYVGRLAPEKGPEVAIRAAKAVGRPLRLVGGIYDAAFFAGEVAPLLGRRATYLGHRRRTEVFRLMAGAAAVLMPSRLDEPFGLVAVEAQAAGAPVVAYARGALPELVLDGVTGFLVPPDDETAFIRALGCIDVLDRRAGPRNAHRWSDTAMLDAHEAVYASALRVATVSVA